MTTGWRAVPDDSGLFSDEPEPELIAWLDPGRMTGWALWTPQSQFFRSDEGLMMTVGEMLASQLSPRAWVGWEAYTLRPGGARVAFQPDSLEVIGMTRWIAYRQHARVLRPQQETDRILGYRHLKTAGWHRPGKGHANDAAAHLLAFLLSYRLLPAEIESKVTQELEKSNDESYHHG